MALITAKHLRFRYELIHVHSVPDFLVFAAWVPRLTGSRVILDIHDLLPELYCSKFGLESTSPVHKILVAVERASIAFSHHVVLPNHIWYQKILSRSGSAGQCTVLLNFPDPEIFCERPEVRDHDKFIILYPGTLSWYQGLDIAIRAFAIIKERIPETEFHIYGEGHSKSELLGLVKDLQVSDRVLFKERVSLRDIAAVMAAADLGVVPKRDDLFSNEALSTKILEFMAVGVPVIVADTKVERYYFNESIVKFFRAGDSNELADAMLLLIQDRELRRHLAENAKKYARDASWEKHEHEYLELVDALLGGRQSPKPKEFQVAQTR
jgi:glycosyltransferase involved in cell wall biosynthesis